MELKNLASVKDILRANDKFTEHWITFQQQIISLSTEKRQEWDPLPKNYGIPKYYKFNKQSEYSLFVNLCDNEYHIEFVFHEDRSVIKHRRVIRDRVDGSIKTEPIGEIWISGDGTLYPDSSGKEPYGHKQSGGWYPYSITTPISHTHIKEGGTFEVAPFITYLHMKILIEDLTKE